MSTEEATSRKAKKAQRDAERKKAGKKRKREEVDESSGKNAQDESKEDFISLAGGDEAKIAKDSESQSKKRKTSSNLTEQDAVDGEGAGPKPKKRRKSKSAETDAASKGDEAQVDGDESAATKSSKNRFILFIGNLPYTATDETIKAHFKSIQPFILRHRVDKKTKKSKGFAFLEFENYDRMKTCLKLYHHSTFDPAAQEADGEEVGKAKKGKKDKTRKINVELTAGGGGKGEERKEKIKAKNVKLEEERKRRREAEEKAAERKEKKAKAQGKKATGANAEAKEGAPTKKAGGDVEEAEGMQGMHPARLAKMKALS